MIVSAPPAIRVRIMYGAGTSYAAPTVAGVIALMLQANPNLGYRDVQQTLVTRNRSAGLRR
jgi:subtilisin family serine protease